MPGFRTGIEQHSFPILCKGGKARLDVPNHKNMKTVIKPDNFKSINGEKFVSVYPEFFLNVNTVNGGGNFDGGIINKGNHWIGFIFGGKEGHKTWQETLIPNCTGERMRLKLKGEVYKGKHSLCLYVYKDGHSEGDPVVVINKDTPAIYNLPHTMGSIAEEASKSGVWRTHYELNLVPTSGEYDKFITASDNEGRAYFEEAEFAECYPIDAHDNLIVGYKWGQNVNCDHGVYPKNVVDKVSNVIAVGDSWIKSSVDFRRYSGRDEGLNKRSN